MGQDIHAYVEYQEKHGSWTQFAHVRLARWYDLFAFMATGGSSRRPNIEPVYMPRGAPEGMDIFTAHAHEKDVRQTGIHHTSWLTLAELEDVRRCFFLWCEAPKPVAPLPDIEDYTAMLAAMTALEKMGYPTRLVFWFDN